MSSFPEISAELAAYFSLAAETLGAAMVGSAAQRIADGSIDAGQGCFRRLFRRGSGGDTPIALPGGRSEHRADQLLGVLSPEDRDRLAAALTTWIGEQRDRGPDRAGLDGAGLDGAGLDGAGLDGAGLDGARLDEARLVELMAAAPAPARTYHVTAHGPNSAAIGSVGDGATFRFGGGDGRHEDGS
ncbi:hypothetical protein AB0I49_33710 [Streptomyces sp. NPDC050617]|uniref:hypothetical protein n=1 Tax=Streptomyces sp. NPDC050617 TaxID=3154628 RepID=UPI00343BF236